jgi:hypothetical protein
MEVDIPHLDEQIESLGAWITKAGRALIGFYHHRRGAFVRDTINPGKKGYSPTSTARSFFALQEFYRFLEEEAPSDNQLRDDVANILRGTTKKFFGLFIKRPTSARQSATNGINVFTDSHILLAAAVIDAAPAWLRDSNKMRVTLRKACARVAKENQRALVKWNGGRIVEEAQIHDFVTLYSIRALDTFYAKKSTDQRSYGVRLRERLKTTVLQMLAYNASGETARFDASELAFSLVAFNRLSTQDVSQLTLCAVNCICQSQSDEGAFPTARPVSYQAGPTLYVASYEVALALTQLLLRKLHQRERGICKQLIPMLLKSVSHVQAYYDYDHATKLRGWANDHTRRDGLIESWATAIVLTFLIQFRDALLMLRQQMVLEKLGTSSLTLGHEGVLWPDLGHALNGLANIDENILKAISDPTTSSRLTKAIAKGIVEPIHLDSVHRPGAKRALLLHGPPGSRKTSLVKRIAESLSWPMVVLSPSEFLSRGLEGFDVSAVEVFRDLRRLRRVVVLFDECEDFFRKRSSKQDIESRTAGAFITSGMLPRLQSLHDQKWIILVVATNSGPEELDTAVTREGRFDLIQKLDYPVWSAERRYIRTKLRGRSALAKVAEAVLRQVHRKTRPKPKSKPGPDAKKKRGVTFQHLDRLVEQLIGEPKKFKRVQTGVDFFEKMLDGPPRLVE